MKSPSQTRLESPSKSSDLSGDRQSSVTRQQSRPTSDQTKRQHSPSLSHHGRTRKQLSDDEVRKSLFICAGIDTNFFHQVASTGAGRPPDFFPRWSSCRNFKWSFQENTKRSLQKNPRYFSTLIFGYESRGFFSRCVVLAICWYSLGSHDRLPLESIPVYVINGVVFYLVSNGHLPRFI